ncbi:MAG: hypothetical protein KF753_18615 [Caldilineaceae bacterium]|nr:hypothetical protein [Caldilineaceae bacterium]
MQHKEAKSPRCRGRHAFLRATRVLLLLTFFLAPFPVARGGEAPAALRILASDASRLLVELTSPAPSLHETVLDGAIYTRVDIAGLSAAGAPGAPHLPAYGRLIALPPGASASLRVLIDDSETVRLSLPVMPVPTQLVNPDPDQLLPSSAGLVYTPDSALYISHTLYPAAAASLGEVSDWRGQRVARLQLNPIQYNPVSGELLVHRRLRVAIRFDGGQITRTATPADPIFGKVRDGLLLNADEADNWRTRPAPGPTPRRAGADQPWYKLSLTDMGLYALTCADLTAAGIDLTALPLDSVQLFHGGPDGDEIALTVQDSGEVNHCDGNDSLRFWGQAIDNKYTDVNVYWLTHGAATGLRMASRAAQPGGTTVTTTTTRLRLEQNRYYAPHMPRLEGYEHWFWDLLSTTNPSYSATRTYTFTLEAGATVNSFTPALAGYTGSHRTQLWFNGSQLSQHDWSGTVLLQPTHSLPPGLVISGTNAISITESYPGSSLIVVDHLDLSGSRPLLAQNDRLAFSAPGPGFWRYSARGFDTPAIALLDITDPPRPVRVTGPEIATPCPCGLAFAEAVTITARYAAIGVRDVRSPLSLEPVGMNRLRSPARGADYILISPAAFLPVLTPLVDLRTAQGLRVVIADIQDIYNEFNGGIADPIAIRTFLAWAYANWQAPAPAYALLVGDGHYDPKGYCLTPGYCLNGIDTPPDSSRIPPYLRLVDPWIGETAADAQLVAFNDANSLPFLALGRLPVNSLAETETVVAKIVAYEQNPTPGAWRFHLAFVADNAYASNGQLDPAGQFWALSDGIADNPQFVLPSLSVDKLYLNLCDPAIYAHCNLPDPPYTSGPLLTAALVDAFNSGRVLINYIGHASISTWAGGPVIFRTSNLAQLSNAGKLPLMLDMTCFTGYYHQPPSRYSSISESLLRLDGGGSIASWAATGLSVTNGHDLMNAGFLDAVMQQGIYPIGLAAVAGLGNLYGAGGGGFLENLDTFLIIGDPATRLALAGGPPPATITPTATPTSTSTPTATATPTTTTPTTTTPTASATPAPVATPTNASLFLPAVQSGG